MNETSKKKSKLKGWLIALIVVAVVFGVGAICCNTIGKGSAAVPQATVSSVK